MYILRSNINICTFDFTKKKYTPIFCLFVYISKKIVNCLARKIANKLSKIYYIRFILLQKVQWEGKLPFNTPFRLPPYILKTTYTIGPCSTTGKMFVSMWTPTTCSIFSTITATHREISISENVPQFSKFPRWKSCLYQVEYSSLCPTSMCTLYV